MHVDVAGPADGRPILLLHGGGVAGWMWRPVLETLAGRYRVIVPDLPGHGASTPEPYRSHAETAAALAGVVERRASRPVAVVGFSLGAQLGVLLASTRPDLIDRAAIVSAQARPQRFPGATLGLLGLAAPLARQRWFARLQARELFVPDELFEDYFRTSATVSRETLLTSVGENLRFTPPPQWARFPGAALVLAGEREPRLVRDSARLLHRLLPGSELEVVPGCGHGIPLQRPDWFAARITDWLGPDAA